jgi:hypothetical protein
VGTRFVPLDGTNIVQVDKDGAGGVVAPLVGILEVGQPKFYAVRKMSQAAFLH